MITANRNGRRSAVLLVLLVFSMAIVAGAGLAAGSLAIVAPIAMVLPAVYLLIRPDISLLLFAALTLIVAGSIKYFFGFGQFQWALSALGMSLLAYSLVDKLFAQSSTKHRGSSLGILIVIWWLCIFVSSAMNQQPILDWLVGIRIYLPAFGIFTYLAYSGPNRDLLRRLILWMLAIASIQWIFSLYQKLEVVPIRIASRYPGSSWDSVVGSFGGDKFGGGESGSLGIYLSIMMVLVAALRKYKEINFLPAAVVFLTGLVAMGLVESKVIAMMIPIGTFLVFRDYIFRRPVAFVAGTSIISLSMLALLFAYYSFYWQTTSNVGFFDAVWQRLAYSFDPDFQATTQNLGRVKSLLFWWDRHSLTSDPLTFLLGHGLASAVSVSSLIGEGVAVKRYAITLDVTGTSKLLWESGVIGFALFVSLFVAGFFRARALKFNKALPSWHRAAMWGVEAAMVLMPISIFYEVTVVSSPPMQFVAMFFLGYVAYWWRETSAKSRD